MVKPTDYQSITNFFTTTLSPDDNLIKYTPDGRLDRSSVACEAEATKLPEVIELPNWLKTV